MKSGFFTRDKSFYSGFFRMFLVIALQNIITYSVNMADNVMLGAYSQTSLSGAAAVNQIQFILQQLIMAGLGEGLVIISGQYWGRGDRGSVARLTGCATRCSVAVGAALTAAAFLFPRALVGVFTNVPEVRDEAVRYISVLRWSYLIFTVSAILLSALRSVQVVGIAFRISCVTLVINVGINYTLIFGRFGAPEMGIRGAAIGTVTARAVELGLILAYIGRADTPLRGRLREILRGDRGLFGRYLRVSAPCAASAILFSSATAVQTAIFGHLSSDAMAAVSLSTTVYQYCKMIPVSAASSAGVLIAKYVGSGERGELRPYVRTLQMIFLAVGAAAGSILLLIREPVISLYELTDRARETARSLLLIEALIAVGMSYQMPCQLGIIRGGGDTRYSMISDTVYSWGVTVPLGLISAFVLRWPVTAVFFLLNVDQLLKCLTVGIKTNSYTWVKALTGNHT